MKLRSPSGLAAGTVLLALLGAAPAHAATSAVTVQLRVEGPARTLFEGRVTTGVRPWRFSGDAVGHRCDGTAANGGASATGVPTRGAALMAAHLRVTGTWSESFGNPTIATVAGAHVAYDPKTRKFLAEYKNGRFAEVGSCGDRIAAGDQVLFAYGTGSETLLGVSGPRTARVGRAVTVRVTDLASGAPVAGATVLGRTTAADGTVALGPFRRRGAHALKAVKAGAIRSNRLAVCATDGRDGFCGAPDRRAPAGQITGIRDGASFAAGHGPRVLRATVAADPSGLRAVRLRLTRRAGGACSAFSARARAFRPARCGTGPAFSAGRSRHVAYRLPARLGPGRYVLDVIATDRAGNRDAVRPGRSRVRFTVR